MATFKDRGIVIKEYYNADYNKTLTLLLKERGKVSVFVKGARRPKSKFFASTQLFCYSEFVIFEGNGFLSLAQADVIKNFYSITGDYNKFCYANLFLELVNNAVLPSVPMRDILYLLLKSLQALSGNAINSHFVSCIFQLKFIQIEGYSPELGECIICRERGNFVENGNLAHQGLVCSKCSGNQVHIIKTNTAIISIMKHILGIDLESNELFKFNVNESYLDDLVSACRFLTESNFSNQLKSGGLL